MSGKQQRISGLRLHDATVLAREHISPVKPPGCRSQFDAEKSREGFCKICHRRITVGESGREYGHARGKGPDDRCPHALDYMEGDL